MRRAKERNVNQLQGRATARVISRAICLRCGSLSQTVAEGKGDGKGQRNDEGMRGRGTEKRVPRGHHQGNWTRHFSFSRRGNIRLPLGYTFFRIP